MKHLVLLLSLSISVLNFKAQINLQWAKKAGSSGTDRAISMTIDDNGNVITTGIFSGTVDFDPGSGSFTMTANQNDNMYVCKLDANGGFLWAAQMLCSTNGFSRCSDICVDTSGNILTTGWFRGIVDFDPASTTNTVASTGSYDMFISKLDPNGVFQWAKVIGGDECVGTSVATDISGNVFTTGYKYGSVDFDPGSGTYTLASVGLCETFVSKLSASGNFIWAKGITGGDNEFGYCINVDPSGDLVITGEFTGTTDFDPGTGTYTLTSAALNTSDAFICKLSNSGSFLWANSLGGGNADKGFFITTDKSGNIYSTGRFSTTVDFDPGSGTYTLSSGGAIGYLLKLNSAGNFVWAKPIGYGGMVETHCISIDTTNCVYLTGMLMGNGDFDPGTGTYTITGGSGQTSFLVKLDDQGNFAWAKQVNVDFYSTIERSGKSIVVDYNRNIHLSGYFAGTVDMDVTSSTYTLGSAGSEDIFASKYCQGPDAISAISGASIACTGATLNFSINPVYGASSYSWSLPSGFSGTSSSNSITVTAGGSGGIISINALNVCGSAISRTLGIAITPSLNLTVSNPIICAPGSVTLFASGASSYTWSTGLISNSLVTSQSVTSTYTLEGSAPGCTNATKIATVAVSPVNLTLTSTSTTLCSGSSATLTAAGAPFYQWNTGSPFSSITVFGTATMSSASYTVTGRNTASNSTCSDTKTITIFFYPSPYIAGKGIYSCIGTTYTMSPSGAATYTFSNGTAIVSPTSNITYSVIGTSSMGCISSTPGLFSFSVSPLPTVSVNSGTLCAGSIFTLVPSGADNYSFSSGSSTVSPSANTTYSVTGVNWIGCLSQNTAVSSVTVLASPVISVNSGSICAGKIFTINPSGAISYSISGGSNTVSPLPGINNFSVTGTDALGCASLIEISTVTVHTLPIVAVNSGSVCAGETFTLIPNGAVSYTYSNGSHTVIPVSSGSFSVTGTSSEGCISLAAISNITVNPLPIILVNSGTICAGQIFTMNPSGASSYTISGGSSVVSPTANSSFSVTGTSAQGCTNTNVAIASVSVVALPLISVNNGSICAGQVFTIIPTGALSYSYSGGVNTVSPLPGISNYSVTGKDLYGCESLFAISTVTTYVLPSVTVNSGSICAGQVFTMNPTGALSYSYSSNSSTVSPPPGITNYSLTGTDVFGCKSPIAISTLTTYGLPIVAVNSGSICAGGTFTIIPTGADNYSFSSVSATVNPLSTGSFTVTGISKEGCVSLNAISTVTVESLPNITISSSSQSICLGEMAKLTAIGALSYTWSGGELSDSIIITPLTTQQFTVSGMDTNGCINSTNFTQAVDLCLGVISKRVGGFKCYPNPTSGELYIETEHALEINLISSLGQIVYRTTLSSGKNLLTLTDLANGIYFVIVKGGQDFSFLKVIKQ